MTGSPTAAARRVDRISLRVAAMADASPDDVVLDHPVVIELDRDAPGLGDRMAERLERIREAYKQTTFYLFDPESWR
jgi:hypothetical protein